MGVLGDCFDCFKTFWRGKDLFHFGDIDMVGKLEGFVVGICGGEDTTSCDHS